MSKGRDSFSSLLDDRVKNRVCDRKCNIMKPPMRLMAPTRNSSFYSGGSFEGTLEQRRLEELNSVSRGSVPWPVFYSRNRPYGKEVQIAWYFSIVHFFPDRSSRMKFNECI